MNENTVAVILGGGVGSRLYPLTLDRSKPAVPIAGKYRLIDIPISNCLNSDIRKIFVLTMYNSASLNKHIKNTYHFDVFGKGFVDILAAEQTRESKEWFQGTADAVRQSLNQLNKTKHKYVLVLSGDHLYNMDFKAILKNHVRQKADVTIATIPVKKEEATSFGIMKVQEDGMIDSFIEKPSAEEAKNWTSMLPEKYVEDNKNHLASMGIYVFNKAVLQKLFNENLEANDFGKEIIPYAVDSDKYRVSSYLYDGYWADIGTISTFLDANLKLTGYLPEFQLYDNVNKIYSHARMLSPTKIFGTKITHGLISDGCIFHADEISHSVIGVRSRIGKGTIIRDAYVIGNSYYQTVQDMKELPDNELLGIGNDCFIKKAIIDRNARVGHNVSIIGHHSLADKETDTYCIREGIVLIKKDVVIPKNAVIGLAS